MTVPGFARLWVAHTVSGFGAPVTLLAVQALVLLELHGSATDVGVVTAARWLPYLLFGLVAGAWVERRRRLPVMLTTDVLLGLTLALIPAMWFAGLLSLPILVAVMAAFGTLTLFADAASQSIMPRLVPGDRLQAAHARLDQSDALTQAGGPALAGLLVSALGAAVAVIVDAVSYLISAVLVCRLPVNEARTPAGTKHPPLLGQIREGLAWVYRQPKLGALALFTHAWFVCNAMLTPVFAALMLVVVRASPFALGLTLTVAGVGALVGATVTGGVGRKLDAGPTIIVCHAITTVGIAIVAVGATLHGSLGRSTTIAVLTIGMALHGLAMGMSNSHEMGYRQLVTSDALQARTNTTMRSVNRAMVVVAAPLGGLLADRLGTGPTLWIVTVGFGLVVVGMLASPVRQARYADARRHSGQTV